ncbi:MULTISPECIES: MogA/MoaB family molybdenum cofactor biosynthesis protein [Bacillaceae]|uniref:MogA/MoaB family molybdenum cofactor biosynthesis protein n=1 Tax=Bacillaceae TaxID=186817 RepID=UPI000B112287|nr:molybdenum cofactor biosynthesis protein B [Bacillus sp. FJAT-27916]
MNDMVSCSSTYIHKKEAPKAVRCKIITVSDTRDLDSDKSGQLMEQLLTAAGHEVVSREVVKDEVEQIQRAVLEGCRHSEVDCVLTNGGTGIAKRDVTIEALSALYEKEIPGFGELFRMLSYQEDIGSAAILSRASAGVIFGTPVFSTPGSSGAVRLAMNKCIIPELGHIMHEIRKDR